MPIRKIRQYCNKRKRIIKVIPAGSDAVAVSASGGQPRDIDVQRVRTMIREQKLSDKEAEFYKQVE
jgi:hypothetical protein